MADTSTQQSHSKTATSASSISHRGPNPECHGQNGAWQREMTLQSDTPTSDCDTGHIHIKHWTRVFTIRQAIPASRELAVAMSRRDRWNHLACQTAKKAKRKSVDAQVTVYDELVLKLVNLLLNGFKTNAKVIGLTRTSFAAEIFKLGRMLGMFSEKVHTVLLATWEVRHGTSQNSTTTTPRSTWNVRHTAKRQNCTSIKRRAKGKTQKVPIKTCTLNERAMVGASVCAISLFLLLSNTTQSSASLRVQRRL